MAQLERPAVLPAAPARERPVVKAIGEIHPQDRVEVTGVIGTATALSLSGCPACRYTLADQTGEVDLMFLGRVAIAGLEPGRRCSAAGTAAARDGRIVIWNPRYGLHPADADDHLRMPFKIETLLARIRAERLPWPEPAVMGAARPGIKFK